MPGYADRTRKATHRRGIKKLSRLGRRSKR